MRARKVSKEPVVEENDTLRTLRGAGEVYEGLVFIGGLLGDGEGEEGSERCQER